MSAGTRISLRDGAAAAKALHTLLGEHSERWQVAGSVRRREASIGDIEHVVIPKVRVLTRPTMFGEEPAGEVNALWEALDEMVAAGRIAKAEYGETRTHRWGELYRGVVFEGIKHELFTADERNWGAILAIRTGPADFSEKMVTWIKQNTRYRQKDGYLRYAGGASEGEVRAVPTEEAYFEAAGLRWLHPSERAGDRIRL